nr:MAG TPA: hypothetical protein [Caudoviricetes sp.]
MGAQQNRQQARPVARGREGAAVLQARTVASADGGQRRRMHRRDETDR